ncbi:alpha/beta hydrolase [Agarivorans sp. B2Z047]|uniref:alpha/beta hydrolase n=1 Tax=Agarivorans sp. B2Z047 TaxID=2652721 RepID=UPI00128DB08B|nr:alpha/beta hydrolase [Agarivorans sp. B2Z047]MPW27597.1 alpha/beta hydrolase [Agarivorans sp. B2Z047]UQN44562.1 alpha/beta hydrolase [Agarivorans sp. B2Z047]
MGKFIVVLLLSLSANSAIAKECVVLLHGMARSEDSMEKMSKQLKSDGYKVSNYGYPSTSLEIEDIASKHVPQAIADCGNAKVVHFVTHSLGGIVLRKYLSENSIIPLGRVVMLGPPNQGSEVVDALKHVPGFEFINGPAGSQLGTEEDSVPNSLGPVTYPVGIIAGSSTFNPLLSQMLPNPDDGKVSVERTKVAGMTDHVVLPVTHTFMMRNDEVISQVKRFLKTGEFEH